MQLIKSELKWKDNNMYNKKGENIYGESYIDSYGVNKSKIRSPHGFINTYGVDCINDPQLLDTYGKEQMLQALLTTKNKKKK